METAAGLVIRTFSRIHSRMPPQKKETKITDPVSDAGAQTQKWCFHKW